MSRSAFSVLDLLDLPPLERDIVLSLSRDGPADAPGLAARLGAVAEDTYAALDDLAQRGRVRLAANGVAEALFGATGRRTTLPPHIWPAILSTDRIYSQQEVATLRTAIPMLQFARARLSQYADHGPAHALRVKSFCTQLGYLLDLTPTEHRLLRAAALFHDIGNIVERDRHHIVSQESVIRLAAEGKLPFSPQEAEVVGLVCRWHRREFDPQREDHLDGQVVRTGRLACILRVSDAMDIDNRRSDYDQRLRGVLEFFFPEEVPYFTSLEEIAGVRIHAQVAADGPAAVTEQVFTRLPVQGNIQIEALKKDIASTPLGWQVESIPLSDSTGRMLAPASGTELAGQGAEGLMPAGLVAMAFPFEPHSLVMAAISRRHLQAAGCGVELICYPDTQAGPDWLWRHALGEEVLQGASAGAYRRLVVIGDRPHPNLLPVVLETARRWQTMGAAVSILNRHEANWARIPRLLEAGVEVILGGDWAYFWGSQSDPADIAWARIAALCNHDPTLSTVGVTEEEIAVMRGLLNAVYRESLQQAGDSAAWAGLAEPIMERIARNERDYFASQAEDFITSYATPRRPGQVHGRLIYFDGPPGISPYKSHWALEAAIEQQGRSPARGVHYHTPYAVATWEDGDAVELVAINHWREEDAAPIRLLYPTGIGPEPHGLESMIHVRLAPREAETVVRRLISACNQ